MIAADFISTEHRLGAHNYQPLDVILSRGEGVWLWDVEGKRYLDCLSAYSAVNQGHCHPKILAAMIEQAKKLTLTSRAFRNDQLALFYEEIAALTGSHKILPMNSGAEAVESAVKAVRKWGYEVKGVPDGKAEIIVAADNFHGRTMGIVGFSTDPDARGGFGPFAPGFVVVPFGDADAFEKAITPNTVAFLVEPIQGEAGVIIPPAGYFAKRARALHAAQGHAHPRRDPDRARPHRQTARRGARGDRGRRDAGRQGAVRRLLSGLGGAFQFRSAGRAEARPAWLDLRRQSAGLRHRARRAEGADRGRHDRELGRRWATYFMTGLRSIRSNLVKEVRGRGLMLAVELHPEAGGARKYCYALKERGLLAKDTHGHTIRIAPPLVVKRKRSTGRWSRSRRC